MLDHALDLLGKAEGRLLGVVLNRVPTSGASAAGTSLRYAGAYYRSSPSAAEQLKAAARTVPLRVSTPLP